MNKVGKSAIKVEEMDRKDEIKLGLSMLVEKKDRNVERKNQESKHKKWIRWCLGKGCIFVVTRI